MERTIPPREQPVKLPDAINSSISRDFTQVPNEILRNPEMSGKAKAILLIIVAHPEVFENIQEDKQRFLQECCKEGPEAISSGVKELEEAGFLRKVTHRNQGGGRKYIIGSTWETN